MLTGLLGGSFNPAHGAHRNISLFALNALGLDEVWWMVSPGNVLKPRAGMAPLQARFASARKVARIAPIRVTAIERELGTRYTIDTLRKLQRRYPRRRFVWLMGSDNLAQFHRWRDWRRIAREMPIAVVARPGYDAVAMASPAMAWLRRWRRVAVNLLLLVAVLSMLQATLTLPGMAAMALVLGMAIDANVLINERVREELRNGAAPQTAIHTGYDRAWSTILDSNVTTLIAGLALLAFGSGPVRGFAVVHCLGILTSMFSAVFFSRGLVNLWYGRQKRLQTVSIGTVWRADSSTRDVIAKAKAD
jgi:nicotinate-nucleotide adenylyltransferase